MPLEVTNVQVPLAEGLDQATDQRLLPAGKVTNLKNGVYNKIGSISKRLGYQQVATGSNHPVMQKLMTFQDQLLGVSTAGNQVYSYSPAANQMLTGAQYTNFVPEAFARRDSVTQDATDITNVDMMSVQNTSGQSFLVYAWTRNSGFIIDNSPQMVRSWLFSGIFYNHSSDIFTQVPWVNTGDVMVTVLDETTGAIVVPPTVLVAGKGLSPKLVRSGPNYVTVTWVERIPTLPSPASLFAATLDLSLSIPTWLVGRKVVSHFSVDDMMIYDTCSPSSSSAGVYPVFTAYTSNGPQSGSIVIEQFNAANLNSIASGSYVSKNTTVLSLGTCLSLDNKNQGDLNVLYSVLDFTVLTLPFETSYYSFWYNQVHTSSIAGTITPSLTTLVDNIACTSSSYNINTSNMVSTNVVNAQSHVYACYESFNRILAPDGNWVFNDQPRVNARRLFVSASSVTVQHSGSTSRYNYYTQLASKPFLRFDPGIGDYRMYAVGRTRFNGQTYNGYGPTTPFSGSGIYNTLFTEKASGQGSLFLFDAGANDTTSSFMSWRPVAAAAQRLANVPVGQTYTNWGFLPNAPSSSVTGDQWFAPVIIEQANQSTGRSGIEQLTFDFRKLMQFQSEEIGRDLHIAGGVPTYWDGAKTGEIGFAYYPEADLNFAGPLSETPVSGDGLLTGTYVYSFVYEWIDNQGIQHQSAPSPDVSITLAGDPGAGQYRSQVTIYLPSLSTGTRQLLYTTGSAVGLAIYRSTVDAGNPVTLYRLSSESITGSLANNPTTGIIEYVDSTPDSTLTDVSENSFLIFPTLQLANNAPIYTLGGVVANFCPPSSRLCTTHVSRLWLAGCDNPKQIWFSKQYSEGDALAFNDSFTFTVDDGGDITAIIGAFDNNLIIFKSDRIFYVQGIGPNDLGQQNDLSDPIKIPSDVGCIEPRSVVMTPDGIMFRSAIGIHMLNRALQVVNVGPAVADLLATYPITTSAIIYPTQNQVRFTIGRLLASGLYEGTTLVYDYLAKAWSYFVIADTNNALTGALAFDSVAKDNVYYWTSAGTALANSGSIFVERGQSDAFAYLDGNAYVSMAVESAWVATNDIAGFQRVRRMQLVGQANAPCNVTASLAMDYEDAYNQSVPFSDTPTSQLFQRELHVGRQKCQAVRIKVEDNAPTTLNPGNGQGLTLQRIVLRAGTKTGMYKLPAGQRA